VDLHLGDDRTLVEVFWGNVERYATRPALRRRGADGWEVLTWAEYGTEVSRLAAGLVHLGLEPGDRVAILCSNRREWHLVDMAVLSVGGATVPVYPTSSSSQVAYVLTDAGCRIAVVEDNEQLAKVLLRRDELDGVEKVVVVDGVEGLDHAFVLDLEHLAAVGDDVLDESPTVVQDRRAALRPDDLATIVYTSGTTGHPKGVTLLHRNLAQNLRNITAIVSIGPDDRFLSFLPLSHIAERTVSHFGQVVSGGETWFAESLASVPVDIQACRPTIFFAVPRVWEKFREGIREKVESSPAPRRELAERYLALAARDAGVTGAGDPLGLPERLQLKALDAIAGKAIRSGLGLDKVWFLVSGAAPVHPDLLRWFQGLGLPIAEVYGQTEDCGVTTLNPPGAIRIGTVGPPVPGVELQIAEDGEVLVRGGHVTPGYHRNPEATAELLDTEGWMRTGDLGELDTEGYLRITGRKKDLIINAAGKNISPQEIETRLRFEPLISQAVVIGDGRAYLTALLTLDVDAVHEWAIRHGRVFPDVESMTGDPALRDEVEASVDRVNAEHARVEGIKRWTLLPRDLSIATGELTPTLKVKRQVVAEQHKDLIEEMYQR
jgi:long-chain acyl-CoA synthetase